MVAQFGLLAALIYEGLAGHRLHAMWCVTRMTDAKRDIRIGT